LILPEVERLIDETWARVASQPGVKLFDGPMCRLESWVATPDRLNLVLSETSYKPFVGTNLHHPELADRYGTAILANPVGVSPALETADGWLMMGRRNASVAYYPNQVHPFAGALEPRDVMDPFGAVRRELAEELGFIDADIAEIRCTGIAEDRSIRQPELIFRVRSTRTKEQVEATLDRTEHHASWAIRASRDAIAAVLEDISGLTPVALAALLLWGRAMFGEEWFRKSASAIGERSS
jgi:8-oxo-dGTP pyrophosphatase MutT (NUDIX family)